MKQTINLYQFREAFQKIRPDNFTYEGLGIVFNYLEEHEAASGQEIELDVIGFCCDFAEDSVIDIAYNYGIEPNPHVNLYDAVVEYLVDNGAFIDDTSNGTIVYLQSF